MLDSNFSQFEEEVSSLQAFTTAIIVDACVRCLQRINPDFRSPKVMPEAMSARYRMCTNLANTVQVINLHPIRPHLQDTPTPLFVCLGFGVPCGNWLPDLPILECEGMAEVAHVSH